MSLTVKERLEALAAGKKLRKKAWAPGGYIHLNHGLIYDNGRRYIKVGLYDEGIEWEIYEEPTVLECWVVFTIDAQDPYGKLGYPPCFKAFSSKEDADKHAQRHAEIGLYLYTEHVRVELGAEYQASAPNEALKELMRKPKQRREFWVNIYPKEGLSMHGTKEMADAAAYYPDRIARKKVVVEFEEGEME